MDQKTIVDALQKALAKGSGTLDDLENLLARAQKDIDQAKKDAEEAKKKADAARGAAIADLATRLVNGETTDDDCAFVLNAWLNAKGHKGQPFNGKDLTEIFIKSEDAAHKEAEKLINDLDAAFKPLMDWLSTSSGKKVEKPTCKKEKNPDDVISDFLRNMGL